MSKQSFQTNSSVSISCFVFNTWIWCSETMCSLELVHLWTCGCNHGDRGARAHVKYTAALNKEKRSCIIGQCVCLLALVATALSWHLNYFHDFNIFVLYLLIVCFVYQSCHFICLNNTTVYTLMLNGNNVAFCTVSVTIWVNVFSTREYTPLEATVALLLMCKPKSMKTMYYILCTKPVSITDTNYTDISHHWKYCKLVGPIFSLSQARNLILASVGSSQNKIWSLFNLWTVLHAHLSF